MNYPVIAMNLGQSIEQENFWMLKKIVFFGARMFY